MTTKIKPSGDRVLVKKIDEDNKTKSGLVLPDDVKERPTKGEILEVGEGRTNDDGKLLPIKVKKGDLVIYPKYAGHPIKVDGEEFLILDEKEILAIFKEEK